MNTCLNLDALKEQFLRDRDGYSFRHLSGYSTKIPFNRGGKEVISEWRLYIMKNSNIIISNCKTYLANALEEFNSSCLSDIDFKMREPSCSYPIADNQETNILNAENMYNIVCEWEKDTNVKINGHIEICREKLRMRIAECDKMKLDAVKEEDKYKKNMINIFRKLIEMEVTDSEIISIFGVLLPLKGSRNAYMFTRDVLLYYKTINKFSRLHEIRVEDAEKVLSEYCDACIKIYN